MEVAKVCLGFSVFLDHCSPSVTIRGMDIWGLSRILGISKLVCVSSCQEVDVLALCSSCSYCISWHNTLFTNFHTVQFLVLCDFQKSGTRMGPCLRFLTAVELLIKRLMIKLLKRDSWAELLPMSDRGHDLPSQPRMLPPAENRPCLDMVPRLLELLLHVRLLCFSCIFPAFSFFKSQVHEMFRKEMHCDPSTVE